MARPKAIEKKELEHMLRVRRLTHAEISKETGMPVATVRYYIRIYDLAAKQLNHKWAVPWTVTREQRGKVYKYLVDLSALSKGKKIDPYAQNTAINWAEDLVAEELDIDYNREVPSNRYSEVGGFFTKPADPENWHLKMVLDKAKAGMLRRLR